MAGPNLGAIANAKIAGVPAWAAVGAIVGGVVLARHFGLFGGGAASPSTTTANVPNQGVPSGFVPASEVGLPPTQTPAPAAPATATIRGQNYAQDQYWFQFGGLPVFPGAGPGGTPAGYVPWGATVTVVGGPVVGTTPGDSPHTSNWWHITTPQGVDGWVDVNYFLSPPGGTSPTGTGGRAGGSRSAVLMHEVHPLVKARVRFPHYYIHAGGATTVSRVAQAAGVHPGRVMGLNSHLRAQGYAVRNGDMVRIA